MPCYSPIKGFRGRFKTAAGKSPIVFNSAEGYLDKPVEVPCGQCIGCRLERSRQWATRCVHEASLHDDNCFITLTYSPEYLPENGTLVKKHYQDFMKRLRFHIRPKKVRYYMCGEYGEKGRPHYHAILFGYDFHDKASWKDKQDENTLYISEELNGLWKKGFTTVGSVTFESAAYVARYIMKKTTGKALDEIGKNGLKPYENYCSKSGEIVSIEPEYTTMSRRPGIGKLWYEQYSKDVYPSDFIIINSKRVRAPKYYDGLLERESESKLEKQKGARRRQARKYKDNNTLERLSVRRKVKESQVKQLSRSL